MGENTSELKNTIMKGANTLSQVVRWSGPLSQVNWSIKTIQFIRGGQQYDGR